MADQARAGPAEPQTLGALLERVAALGGQRPAITCAGRTVTFGELDRRACQVANALAGLGVRPGDRVAALMRNGHEFIELMFGTARAGAVLVGLNWRLAGPEIEAVLAHAEPAALVVAPDLLALVPGGEIARLNGRTLELGEAYTTWADAASADRPDIAVSAGDVVLQLYSSGTTGLPKGARLTHANLAYTPRMGTELYGMTAESVNLLASPLFHIGGAGYGLSCLGQGGHTVLPDALDAGALLAAIGAHRVTHAFLVPAVVQLLIDSPDLPDADLTSLQLIAYGGAPMTEPLLRRAMAALSCGFMAVYGMTETAGTVLALDPADHDPGGPRAGLLRSVGLPLPWHEVTVVDPATGVPAPPGEVGEIWVRSPQNMPGYWRSPAETAATLTADGWLRTGDAAYADEAGYIFLHDRIKDMIISGGENIYPAEVENVLAAHPAIAQVAVIGVPSERWGETVKALAVPVDGAQIVAADVIEFARGRLARYKCPTSVDVVAELPRNASGKVLKKVLRAQHGQAGQGGQR